MEPGIEQFLNDRLQQIEVEADKFRGEEASASQDNSVTTFSVLGKKILLVDDDPDY
jgi:hypoxanthine phosphoribosyltransferase